MKLYRFLFILLLAFFTLACVLELSSYSDGPPPSRTAAPGELNCSNGYCHNNFQLNSGPGEALLSSNIPENGFQAGQTYEIKAKIKQSGQQRFGFMVLAYDSVTQVSTGKMQITEPERTQLSENMDGDRIYVSHNPATIAPDSSVWTFNWTAPAAEENPESVAFYAAFVAANNNNNASGDYVYATSLIASVDSGETTSIREYLDESLIRARVIPQSNLILVEGGENSSGQTEIEVLTLGAQQLYFRTESLRFSQQVEIATQSWPSGVYILKLRQGNKSRYHKFRIFN